MAQPESYQTPTIFQGSAPEPLRRASIDEVLQNPGIEPTGPNDQNDAFFVETNINVSDPAVSGYPNLPPLESTPPPADPDAAAEEGTYKHLYGQLQSQMGEMRAEMDRKLAEAKFEQSLNSPASVPGIQLPPLPPELAQEGVTAGALHQFMASVIPSIQADAVAHGIRAAWSVTPDQERDILARYPAIQSQPEPNRTRSIARAAAFLAPNGSPNPATAPTSAAPTPAPRVVRAAAPTVPHVEATRAPVISDAPAPNRLAQLNAEYQRLDQAPPNEPVPVRKAREVKLKQVYNEILRIQGVNENDQRQGWIHSS